MVFVLLIIFNLNYTLNKVLLFQSWRLILKIEIILLKKIGDIS